MQGQYNVKKLAIRTRHGATVAIPGQGVWEALPAEADDNLEINMLVLLFLRNKMCIFYLLAQTFVVLYQICLIIKYKVLFIRSTRIYYLRLYYYYI